MAGCGNEECERDVRQHVEPGRIIASQSEASKGMGFGGAGGKEVIGGNGDEE